MIGFNFENITKTVLKENSGGIINLTNEINEYLKLCSNYDIINADMSIKASKLHRYLMDTLFFEGSHQYTECRAYFTKILNSVRPMMKRGGTFTYDSSKEEWTCKLDVDSADDYYIQGKGGFDSLDVDDYDVYNSGYGCCALMNSEYCVPFSTRDVEIIYGNLEYRDGSHNGSSGFWTNPDTTFFTKKGYDFIRSKGLVPAIVVSGSYHENFLWVIGVFPEKWEEFKRLNDGCLITRVKDE